MSSSQCEFSLILEGSIRSLVEKARQAVVSAGGVLVGDQNRGGFAVPTPKGKIEGVYRIEGISGDFFITKRPLSISTAAIKSHLQAFQEHLHATRLQG